MKKIIIIYGLLNPLNNSLFYIGITNNVKRRLNEHKKYKYNPFKDKIIEEILKEGKDVDVIELERTEEIWNDEKQKYEHDLLEIKWIRRAKELGNVLTNMTNGGSGGLGEIGKIDVFQYNENGDYIGKHSSLTEAAEKNNVTISKISMALDQKTNKSSKGYYWFTSKDLSNKFKFKKTSKKNIKIITYDLDGNQYKIFDSQSEGEKLTGVKSRQINKCLNNTNKKRAGNYQWFYYDKSPQKINKWIDPNLKPVCQFDIEGNFIKEYSSIKEASTLNNINQTAISKCCNKKIKSSGGYQWSFDKKINESIKNSYRKTVNQFDLNGNYIKTWESISKANRFYSVKSIGVCCRGITKFAVGYIWKYNNY